jgi:WD40 repeat protein
MNSPSDQASTDTVFHFAERLRNSQGADADAALHALRARAAIDACDRASAWKSLGEFRRAKEALQECHAEHRGFEWRCLHASLDESHAAQAFSVAQHGQLRAWFHEASESIVVSIDITEDRMSRFEVWDSAFRQLKHRVEFGRRDLLAHSRCGTRWIRIDGERVLLDGIARAAPIQVATVVGNPMRIDAEFSPDGKQFAWRGSDGVCQMRCAETGDVVYALEGRHESNNRGTLRFDPHGTRLIGVADPRGALIEAVWRLPSGERIVGFGGRPDELDAGFHSLRQLTSSAVVTTRSWKTEFLTLDGTLIGRRVESDPDSFASACDAFEHATEVYFDVRDERVLLTEMATGCSRDVPRESWDGRRPRCVSGGPKHAIFAVGCSDGTIRLHGGSGPGDSTLLRELCGHEAVIRSIEWREDGRRFLSASWDGTVRLWDVGAEVACIERACRSASDVEEWRTLAINGGMLELRWAPQEEGAIRVCVRRGDSEVQLQGDFPGDFDVRAEACGDDLLAMGPVFGGRLGLWHPRTGALLDVVGEPHDGPDWYFQVAVSVDGRRVAMITKNDGIVILDRAQELRGAPVRIPRHWGRIRFDASGSRLVFSAPTWTGGAGVIKLFDAATGAPLLEVIPPAGHLHFDEIGTDFSPDGRWIAAACYTFVAVWDANTGAQRWCVRRPENSAGPRVRFNGDGSRVCILRGDEIQIFDAATGRLALRERNNDHHDLSKDWLPRHESNPADWTADSWLGLHDAPRRVREAEWRHVAGSGGESPLERYKRECRGEAEPTWLSDPLAPHKNESARAQEPSR